MLGRWKPGLKVAAYRPTLYSTTPLRCLYERIRMIVVGQQCELNVDRIRRLRSAYARQYTLTTARAILMSYQHRTQDTRSRSGKQWCI